MTRLTVVVMFCTVAPGVVEINCTKLARGAPIKSIITMAPLTRVGNSVLPRVVRASNTSVLISSMPRAERALSGKYPVLQKISPRKVKNSGFDLPRCHVYAQNDSHCSTEQVCCPYR